MGNIHRALRWLAAATAGSLCAMTAALPALITSGGSSLHLVRRNRGRTTTFVFQVCLDRSGKIAAEYASGSG